MKKFRKLFSMGPAEIQARLHEAAFAKYEKVLFLTGMPQPATAEHHASAARGVLRLDRW